MIDFDRRIAVITGGASGVGKEIARVLVREGARVVIGDINQTRIDSTCEELSVDGGSVEGYCVDVTKSRDVSGFADAVFESYETVHLLFNNAGVGVREAKRRIWTLPDADWQWAYAVNVMGVVNGIRAFVPRMLSKGAPGHVVNTSSGNGGIASLPTTPIYASSKAAVTSLTEVLQHQFDSEGAQLSAHLLFPGPFLVRTNILNSGQNRPEAYNAGDDAQDPYISMEALAESAGVGMQLTEPEEVAEMAIAGIRAGDFWIMSRRGRSDARLQARAAAILDRRRTVVP